MSEHSLRIACFGDSLTQGYGLQPDEALPVVLEGMLREEGIQATCLNFGISGDTTDDGLARMDAVMNAAPHAAIVEFGANDCFVEAPIQEVVANLSAIIERLQHSEIPMLLVGISAISDIDDSYKQRFDPIFSMLAKKYDVPLFPDILSCYFGNALFTLLDGLHPNDQGVIAIARNLLPQVIELTHQIKK